MGIDEVDDSQVLCQGIKQGRGAELPGLHGHESRDGLWVRRGGRLGTELLEHTLAGAEINLLDDTRLALEASGAHPIEVGFIFFPFGDQA